MSKETTSSFLYRVLEMDKRGKQRKHLAEVKADCDENARRKIVHTAMAEGGRVQMITATGDGSRYPGDSAKRTYRD